MAEVTVEITCICGATITDAHRFRGGYRCPNPACLETARPPINRARRMYYEYAPRDGRPGTRADAETVDWDISGGKALIDLGGK